MIAIGAKRSDRKITRINGNAATANLRGNTFVCFRFTWNNRIYIYFVFLAYNYRVDLLEILLLLYYFNWLDSERIQNYLIASYGWGCWWIRWMFIVDVMYLELSAVIAWFQAKVFSWRNAQVWSRMATYATQQFAKKLVAINRLYRWIVTFGRGGSEGEHNDTQRL